MPLPSPSRRAGRAGLATALVASLIGAPRNALAHHPANTSHVGVKPADTTISLKSQPVASLRSVASVGHDFVYFGRPMRKSKRDESVPLGDIGLNLARAELAILTASGTEVMVGLPFGSVKVTPSVGDRKTSWGLGDLQLNVSQRFNWRPWEDHWIQFFVSAGVSAPTGKYQEDSGLNFLEISPEENGGLNAVSHFSQASLGAGSWSGLSAARVQYKPGVPVFLGLSSGIVQPVSTAGDGIQWGRDITIRGDLTLPLGTSPWLVSAALDYWRHSANRISGPDGTQQGGASQQLALQMGLGVALNAAIRCDLTVSLPMWQFAAGVQLMKSVASGTSCQWALDL